MNQIVILLPIALFLGFLGLLAFIWSINTGQYDDMQGAAERILLDENEEDNRGA